MRRHAVIVAGLAVCLAYAASPYVTLYRLDHALRSGDANYINAHVDWGSLRDGVVTQIDAAITGQAAPPQDSSELPAFGSGFVHHMTTHLIDKAMARDAMMARIKEYAAAEPAASEEAPGPAQPDRAVQWACFDGLNSFHVVLNVGDGGAVQQVRLEMRLVDGIWQVTRADVPPALLMQTASRT